jgi:hypothetical protein
MGQAKQRGSFEDRRQQAIARDEADFQEDQRKAGEWWDALTPEEQDAHREKLSNQSSSMRGIGMWITPLLAMNVMYSTPRRR